MRPLAIALTVDPYLPVPPELYGGIERVVDFLVRGLAERGHRLTLFAHPESRPPSEVELVPYGSPPHRGPLDRSRELAQVGRGLWQRRRDLDLVHSFGRLAALVPVLPRRPLAKVQSYQRDGVPWASVAIACRLAGPSIAFTGCSSSVFRERPPGGRHGHWRAIFNGVDTGLYTFRPEVPEDAPLVFLGRLEAIKGVHHAIAIARRAGRRLVIAGNRVEEGSAAGYFDREIAPFVDDADIRWVGPVGDRQKDEILGGAAALLMPIGWEEPFGIVMAEAFACGTPVIAFARGSVPEVVRDGVNGFVCRNVEEAAAAVDRLGEIDRRAVWEDCRQRFSERAIVDAYEELYREVLDARGNEDD